jgi:hypothetical protein
MYASPQWRIRLREGDGDGYTGQESRPVAGHRSDNEDAGIGRRTAFAIECGQFCGAALTMLR